MSLQNSAFGQKLFTDLFDQGLAIITVLKAGFLFSGRVGSGLVIARKSDGCASLSRLAVNIRINILTHTQHGLLHLLLLQQGGLETELLSLGQKMQLTAIKCWIRRSDWR